MADVGMETEAVRTIEPVKIIEVKGRNAGWLAAAAALAKRSEQDAPQFVWPPEVPFSEETFLRFVQRSLREVGYCLAVVAETIRDARGRPVALRGRKPTMDAFGHPRLAGVAEYLCELLKEQLDVCARFDVPGSIQRMSSAHFSEVDLDEARACGVRAVRFALARLLRLHGGYAPQTKRKIRRGIRLRATLRNRQLGKETPGEDSSTAAACCPPPPSAVTPCRSSAPDSRTTPA